MWTEIRPDFFASISYWTVCSNMKNMRDEWSCWTRQLWKRYQTQARKCYSDSFISSARQIFCKFLCTILCHSSFEIVSTVAKLYYRSIPQKPSYLRSNTHKFWSYIPHRLLNLLLISVSVFNLIVTLLKGQTTFFLSSILKRYMYLLTRVLVLYLSYCISEMKWTVE